MTVRKNKGGKGMRKSIPKTISFKEEYFEELDFLNKQQNSSKYICELIRKDMNARNTPENIAKEISELLMQAEMLKEKLYENKK